VSILQGTARHGRLGAIAAATALANVGLSIALAGPLGVVGVALGTLVPTVVETVFVLMPYAMRQIGVGIRELFGRVLLPALAPALPAVLVLLVLDRQLDLASRPALMAAIGCGGLVYLVGYFAVGASALERRAYRSFVVSALRFAGARYRQA
jgi:peptidoglycan biosynthesis protein MviN/MurJ (putative lipid II flippase)